MERLRRGVARMVHKSGILAREYKRLRPSFGEGKKRRKGKKVSNQADQLCYGGKKESWGEKLEPANTPGIPIGTVDEKGG